MADSKQINRRLNRRHFLGLLTAVGAGALGMAGIDPLMRLANAAGTTVERPHHFIFCYFGGGWDILLGLDPRDPAVFTPEAQSETRIQPGYDQLPMEYAENPLVHTPEGITFGPYIGDLAKYANRIALVRGLSMETLSHEGGRRRFITGRVPVGVNPRGSSIATHMASLMGATQAMPNLGARHEVFNLDQPAYASALQVDSVNDLLRALRPGAVSLSSAEERLIDNVLTSYSSCEVSQKSNFLQSAEVARLNARSLVDRRVDSLFDFLAQTAEMEALRGLYGIGNSSSALTSYEALGAMAVTAITSGLTRCASIAVTGGLDTHGDEWATAQGPRQERGFNLIARMLEDLASREYNGTGSSWLEHTTLVAFSEFSRTSLLNGYGGRDHALTNACLLVGGGIKGGQVIGQSSDVGMSPSPTNLLTGQPDPGGEIIKPEHVMRALFEMIGVTDDVADLRVPALSALL